MHQARAKAVVGRRELRRATNRRFKCVRCRLVILKQRKGIAELEPGRSIGVLAIDRRAVRRDGFFDRAQIALEIAKRKKRLGIVGRELRSTSEVRLRAMHIAIRSARKTTPKERIRVTRGTRHSGLKGIERLAMTVRRAKQTSKVDQRIMALSIEAHRIAQLTLGGLQIAIRFKRKTEAVVHRRGVRNERGEMGEMRACEVGVLGIEGDVGREQKAPCVIRIELQRAGNLLLRIGLQKPSARERRRQHEQYFNLSFTA